MKKIILLLLLFFLPQLSQAATSCSGVGVTVPTGTIEETECLLQYDDCQAAGQAASKAWNNCVGWGADPGVKGCNGITRESWLLTPTNCPSNYKTMDQFKESYSWGKENLAYCSCVEACGAQPGLVDCNPDLKVCCQEIADELEEEVIDDAYCQEEYGLAHADEDALNGCRCNTPDAKMNPATGQCEYTVQYLDADCAQKKGAAYWDETVKDCACVDFTDYNAATGKCEGEGLEVTQARQELQYAFYYQIITKGLATGGDLMKAANIALGLSTSEAEMDTGELRTLLAERRDMYQQMSEWNLGYEDTIRKAAEILKGKKVEVGRVKLEVEDESTVYSMINDNWVMLLTGKIKVDDQVQNLKVATATKLVRPKGTVYSVEYNLENGFEEVKVLEGLVEVDDLENDLISQEVVAGQAYTGQAKEKFSWVSWLILGLSLFIGLAGLIVAIIIGIKKKKFLMPLLIFLPFLLISLILLGVFIYKAAIYLGQETVYSLSETGEILVREEESVIIEEIVAEEPAVIEEGYLLNEDYGFLLKAGINYTDKLREVKSEVEGAESLYVYCFDTSDDTKKDVCNKGEVAVFSVKVLTKKQWDKDKEAVFPGTFLGKQGDLYFALYTPQGDMPKDVPGSPEYYERLVENFEFKK